MASMRCSGGSLSSLSRVLLAHRSASLQTGLVLRLIYRTSVPLAFVHGLILHLTWGAVSVLVMLCEPPRWTSTSPRRCCFIAAALRHQALPGPGAGRRLMDSIPPTAPNVPVAQR
jgi:hypothetical protein